MVNLDSKDKKTKGFAGLDSMVSDVSAVVDEASKSTPQKTPSPSVEKSSDAEPSQHSNASADRNTSQPLSPKGDGGYDASGWVFLFVAFIIVAFTIFISWISSNSETSAPYTATSSDTLPPPVATPADLPAPVSVTPDIATPPVGQNQVLNVSQIRYCKTEKIRIDAFESVINNEYQHEVDRFNEVVNDYNSRCGAFRYRRGDVERAQREIDPMRESITAAAKSEWVRSSLGLQEPSKSVPSKPALPAQKARSECITDMECETMFPSLPDEKQKTSSSGNAKMLVSKNAAQRNGPERQGIASPSNETLNAEEKSSIESACSGEKIVEGPAAYNKCVSQKISSLNKGPRNIDLSGLNREEKSSIESACSGEKIVEGPAAYNKCVSQKISSLNKGPRNIDLSGLNREEKSSIESACSGEKIVEGPAAYNKCVSQKISSLNKGPRNIDLSGLNREEKSSIESACSGEKIVEGPAEYNKCLTQKLRQLKR